MTGVRHDEAEPATCVTSENGAAGTGHVTLGIAGAARFLVVNQEVGDAYGGMKNRKFLQLTSRNVFTRTLFNAENFSCARTKGRSQVEFSKDSEVETNVDRFLGSAVQNPAAGTGKHYHPLATFRRPESSPAPLPLRQLSLKLWFLSQPRQPVTWYDFELPLTHPFNPSNLDRPKSPQDGLCASS